VGVTDVRAILREGYGNHWERNNKSYAEEHGGSNVDVDRSTAGLIVLADGKIAGEGRPVLSEPYDAGVCDAKGSYEYTQDRPEK
jgi:hypothetical protein